MKVTVLIENSPGEGLACEHGLSLLVEHGLRRCLIDTGASGLFSENGAKLGIDLSQVDTAFLSHAHYDHAGGFARFFQLNSKAKVYLQSACKGKYYFKIIGPVKKYIGIPEGLLEEYPDRFEYVDGYRDLGGGIYLCPHTSGGMARRGERAHMYTLTDEGLAADDFSHEQTVVFEEDGGLYLFNSCSHGGVEQIIEEVKSAFPDKPIQAFFGGFHLMGALGPDSCAFSQTEVKALGEALLHSSSAVFYTGHCTGSTAGGWLKEVLGERFVPLRSGMTVSTPSFTGDGRK